MSWDNHFALWKESEAIAIHFNELIITLRTQALGGLAPITGNIIHKQTRTPPPVRPRRTEPSANGNPEHTIGIR